MVKLRPLRRIQITATKRSEQVELNLLKEETYKYKYNVEVQNICERLYIEETEQQPNNGSFNNQCDKKWTTVKQSIKSSLNVVLPSVTLPSGSIVKGSVRMKFVVILLILVLLQIRYLFGSFL